MVSAAAAGDVPSEPTFRAARGRRAEGRGWVIALVYRGAENRSDFAAFDAGDIGTGPIGVAKLPRRVPRGFHGNRRPA